MSETGPAFPVTSYEYDRIEGKYVKELSGGLTKKEYAAIHLRVPNSGTDWLDEMIREANRNELAAKAMEAMFIVYPEAPIIRNNEDACTVADSLMAMLAERGRE